MAEAIAERVRTRHEPTGRSVDDAAYEDAVDDAMRRERGGDAGSPA
jgi:hypothetical protein